MREIKRTQQQPIPTYRGSYSTAAAAQTWPQLDFGSQFLAAGFRIFERELSQNLLRCHISLIAEKTKCGSLLHSSIPRQLAA